MTILARPFDTDETANGDALPAAARWFGTGRSAVDDSREAGKQATAAALNGRTAALVIVFCPAAVDLAAMLDGVRSESGDVPLIGCTGVSQYSDDGQVGAAVVVSALGGDGFQIVTSMARDVSAGQRVAGEQVAASVAELTREHSLLLLICDGLAGDQHELVRGAYSVVGAAVPLAGGCAADELEYKVTSQFYSDAEGVHVLTDAVVAAAIGSDAPVGVGVAHGWRKVGEPMLVTASTGGVVRALDGRPALDVFVERVGAVPDVTEDAQAFRLFALHHPLGMSRRSGEDIRVIHGGNREDGSISCLVDVAQGSLLWVMDSDEAGLVATVDDAYDEAVESLGGQTPLGFLAFDCGVRFLFLGPEGTRKEVDGLISRVGNAPLAGFYTFGEIARTRGARGMHHLTLVLVAFA